MKGLAADSGDGEVRGLYHKVLLPTYGVFDEARDFAPGTEPGAVWRIGGTLVGVSICEDAWSGDGPPEAQARQARRCCLLLNASLFHRREPEGRLALAASVARRNGLPLVELGILTSITREVVMEALETVEVTANLEDVLNADE